MTDMISKWNPPRDVSERMLAAVSETVEEATAEPIKHVGTPFRVGVYSDGSMVLERSNDVTGNEFFGIDKTEFAVLVAFARTVGWLE